MENWKSERHLGDHRPQLATRVAPLAGARDHRPAEPSGERGLPVKNQNAIDAPGPVAEGRDSWHIGRVIAELERMYVGAKRREANGQDRPRPSDGSDC